MFWIDIYSMQQNKIIYKTNTTTENKVPIKIFFFFGGGRISIPTDFQSTFPLSISLYNSLETYLFALSTCDYFNIARVSVRLL